MARVLNGWGHGTCKIGSGYTEHWYNSTGNIRLPGTPLLVTFDRLNVVIGHLLWVVD